MRKMNAETKRERTRDEGRSRHDTESFQKFECFEFVDREAHVANTRANQAENHRQTFTLLGSKGEQSHGGDHGKRSR